MSTQIDDTGVPRFTGKLDVFIAIAHRQQAQERQGVGRGEVGQAPTDHDAAGGPCR
jgi:hypothetical protein